MAEIIGTDGADSLLGTSEGDTLDALAGDDTIDGGAGNDFLAPGPGNDSIEGGEGFDYLDYSFPIASQGVIVDLSLGHATDAWGDTDTFTGIENVKGSSFGDTLIGDGSNNRFDPGAGNDVIDGGGGIDYLVYIFTAGFQGVVVDLTLGQATDGFNDADTFSNIENVGGSDFDDTLIGDSGNNTLVGYDGDDTLQGGAGNDILVGRNGDDSLHGGDGDDHLNPGSGNDVLDGGDGEDFVRYDFDIFVNALAGAVINLSEVQVEIDGVVVPPRTAIDPDGGVDTLISIESVAGTAGNDFIHGSAGRNFLFAGDGDDTLIGGDGDDNLNPGPGNDVLDGGDGFDIVEYGEGSGVNALAGVVINLSEVQVEIDGVVVSPRTAIDRDGGVDTLINIESAGGTNGNDTIITGTDTTGTIAGRAGDDTIIGSANHEVFNGGPGNDFIDGGGGEDWIVFGDNFFPFPDPFAGVLVNLSNDVVEINGAVLPPGTAIDPYGDVDTLIGIKYITGTDNDDAIFAGASTRFVDGFDGDDTIVGLESNDFFFGGKGNDTLIGGAGDDVLFGGPGDDFVDGGEGFDVFAVAGDSLDDYLIVEADGVTTITDLNLADGDEGTDTLVNVEEIGFIVLGTEEADRLFSEKDKPVVLAGLDGDDFYILVNQDDRVFESINEGNDTVEAGITRRLEANVENLTLTGDANVNGFGNGLNNEINGNVGNNVIDGGVGADRMAGGSGADTYYVDDEGDEVIETGTQILNLSTSSESLSRIGEGGSVSDEDVADDIDKVVATISYALTDFVENLTLAGDESINGTGNALDNVIIGNSGDNVLSTETGADDRLSGNAGDDLFIVNKTVGKTLIKDLAGGDDTLDLSEFVDGEITVGSSGDALVIENTAGGIVAVYGFFANGDAPIRSVDVGNGEVDVSTATDSAAVAQVLGATDLGELASIIDDDGNLFDSSLVTNEGAEVSTAEAQLFRTYSGSLGRDPDDSGYAWWLNQIAIGNHDLHSMATGFIFSKEFTGFFNAPDGKSIDNADFVNHMYVNVFGREPDQGGFDFWFGELVSGDRSQTDVLVEMTQSNEYVQLTVYSAVDYLVG